MVCRRRNRDASRRRTWRPRAIGPWKFFTAQAHGVRSAADDRPSPGTADLDGPDLARRLLEGARQRRKTMAPDPIRDKEQAEGSEPTVDEALEHANRRRQGVTNKPVEEERRQQDKLPPRGEPKAE
jgi:hypothetical protein